MHNVEHLLNAKHLLAESEKQEINGNTETAKQTQSLYHLTRWIEELEPKP